MWASTVDHLIYTVLNLNKEIIWVKALNFFIYDTGKILLLLFAMITVIGYIRTFLPPEKIKIFIKKTGYFGYFFASLFGAATPFCSCSSIPIFFGFIEAGMPLGITFSFLITSPMINEYLLVLMAASFGIKVALMYLVSGLVIGTVSGIILGKFSLEKYLVDDIAAKRTCCDSEKTYKGFKPRFNFGISEAVSITKKIWIWVIAGVAVGAVIHNWVPSETIQGIISKTGIFSVPIAVTFGVPMYGSCAAIVPIAVVLFNKGVPLGTALAFMMAVAALSVPEAVILKRAMKTRLIAIFFTVTSLGIMLTGYIFNYLQNRGF